MNTKLIGKVIKGAGRGKSLGFPTANLDAVADIEEGIYVGIVKIYNAPQPPLKLRGGEGELPALLFIGAAETFGESEKKVEIYILDFQGDLYGQELRVEILKKLRDNIKFGSGEELTEQMKHDELAAREYFSKTGSPLYS